MVYIYIYVYKPTLWLGFYCFTSSISKNCLVGNGVPPKQIFAKLFNPVLFFFQNQISSSPTHIWRPPHGEQSPGEKKKGKHGTFPIPI